MMVDVDQCKRAWRSLMGDLFHLIPREERRPHDQALSGRTERHVEATGATMLMGFAPMSDEPDLSVFYRRWLARGGGFCLPVWLGGSGMTIRRVEDIDRQLHPGRAGIMEPLETLEEVSPERIDLVIAPGRAFSESCARLGRGSGCYDALFKRYGMARFGVAYDFQVFPDLPLDDGDMPLDCVITPTRMVSPDAGDKDEW